MELDRIILDTAVLGGKPCSRGPRVTLGAVLGLIASGVSRERIPSAHPYRESENLEATRAYAAWGLEERGEDLTAA